MPAPYMQRRRSVRHLKISGARRRRKLCLPEYRRPASGVPSATIPTMPCIVGTFGGFAHRLAGPGGVAQLLRQFRQADFGADGLLVTGREEVLRWLRRGAASPGLSGPAAAPVGLQRDRQLLCVCVPPSDVCAAFPP